MSDWSSGYLTDLDYTYGYYPELNPLRCRLGLLQAGVHCPRFDTACELGFGQGVSANFHAAATATRWYGTDFNPAHAGFAHELAGASGADARLFDEAFADFCARADLPDFDFIGLHGIWSWISDENRRVIVDFTLRKLKVGGVLYISYNTFPGWTTLAPMRDLMLQHTEALGARGRGITSLASDALQFARDLVETKPLFAQASPQVADKLAKLSEKNPNYLAHEYFNRDWEPMNFAAVRRWLEPAKVDFACPARLLDQFDSINLTDEQREFVNKVPDPMLRQSVRDLMVNQNFRADYWVRGVRRASALEQAEAVKRQRIIMTVPREDVSLKITGRQRTVSMKEDIYNPVLDALADCQAVSVNDLHDKARAGNGKLTFPQVVDAVMVLAGRGSVSAAQDNEQVAGARQQTGRLNEHLVGKACNGREISYLASPVTGGGVPVTQVQQLFIDAKKRGAVTPKQLSRAVWELLSRQKRRVLKDGKALETEADNLEELNVRAQKFLQRELPVFKALKVS